MSLTSYRAAPPRVQRKTLWVLARRRNRFAVMPSTGAKPIGFCSCKGRTIIRQVRRSFILYVRTTKSKRPLARPDVFGWAEVSIREDLLLRLADLAATDSPAS